MTPLPWEIGETVACFVRAHREGDRSCYTGWIRPSATSDWRCLGTLKTRAGGALLTCLYSFIEDFRRDFCSAGQNRQASFSNGWVRKAGPPSSWCSLSTADFTASDAEWEAKETIDAGACTRGFYLSTGGDVCSSVDVGCRIDCSHIRRRHRFYRCLKSSNSPNFAVPRRYTGIHNLYYIARLANRIELTESGEGSVGSCCNSCSFVRMRFVYQIGALPRAASVRIALINS